ncbi:MAG: sulfide/dihydroorotate dehydrogenase-like FAD/NAD-binding protein [Methanomicrobiales archaeon]|nr:sulfide/dihydroorotate dehydrogenase-like FAD/NAD-binding protein [Methanomicrobiales archaeon]
MYRIEKAAKTAENIFEFWIHAPHVARNARAGQFLVLRIDEHGERIPLTVSGVDGDAVRVVFMAVGKTTTQLARMAAGDAIRDVAGPLGKPTDVKDWGTCVVIGGGVGIACTPIIARELKAAGNTVIGIIGARNAGLLLLEDEMREACDELVVCTDDGSKGYHGFPADILKKLLAERTIDAIWIIGPAIMMKITSGVSKSFGVKTFVSLNPIMVDGTGMCGSCRVTVGGETRFACVDGPEFDAHEVDFDELMQRQRIYVDQERASLERFHEHECRCGREDA